MVTRLSEKGFDWRKLEEKGGKNAIFGDIGGNYRGVHFSAILPKKNATFRAILHDFMVIRNVFVPYIPKYREKKAILTFNHDSLSRTFISALLSFVNIKFL